EREAESARARWSARRDALELSMASKGGTGSLLGDEHPPGILGAVAEEISVAAGYENAIAAALGTWADAAAVDSVEAGVDAVRRVRDAEAGQARLVVAGAGGAEPNGKAPLGQWARDLVRTSDGL